MQNIKYFFACITSIIVLMASCKKDDEMYIVKQNTSVQGLTASAGNIVLTEEAASDTAVTFSWNPADLGGAGVAYTLQIALPSDTSGTDAWSKANSLPIGNGITKFGITAERLNSILGAMEVPAEIPNDVVIRVKAEVVRLNVKTDAPNPVSSVYSTPLTVKVTPYSGDISYTSFLWVPGAYQGWDPASAPKIVSVNSDKIFEGYVDITAGEFKLTAQAAWEPMAYGDGGDEKLIEANFAGGNFNATSSGNYFVYANLNTMKYKFIKTSWGIIGDATPTGWDSDTDLNYDPATKIWSVTLDLKNTGSFKFRANDGWSLAMGLKNGKLAYSDNPVYPYDATVGNLSVAEAGNYTITLDFSKPGNYKFRIKKN